MRLDVLLKVLEARAAALDAMRRALVTARADRAAAAAVEAAARADLAAEVDAAAVLCAAGIVCGVSLERPRALIREATVRVASAAAAEANALEAVRQARAAKLVIETIIASRRRAEAKAAKRRVEIEMLDAIMTRAHRGRARNSAGAVG